MALAAFLPFLLVCAALGAPEPNAPKPTSHAPDPSDQVTDALLNAMKTQNYAAAFNLFDPVMQDAVPQEKLRAVWSSQVGNYGPLVSWSIVQRTTAQGRDVRVARLKFDHGDLQAMVAVNPDTHTVGGFRLQPAPSNAAPAPGPPYINPSRFHSEEISIGTAPWTLGATLTVPTDLGPVPAAILVHGSGPQDRDETIGSNKVFKDIAEGLASRGIEVLRYDKRTYVYGTKMGDSVSVDDEVIIDAEAALAALRARAEVDPNRIYVIGHSMGALLAPEIGVRSTGPIAGVALLAPPGRAPWDIVISQMKYLNAPPEDMADAQDKVNRLQAGTLGKDKLLGASQSYWKDLGSRDGIAMAKKLGKPVLILHGGRDFQVIDEDIDAWRKGLAGVPNVEIATIPNDSHLFIAGEGKPGPAEYQKPGHVDVHVIDKLAMFIAPAPAPAPPPAGK